MNSTSHQPVKSDISAALHFRDSEVGQLTVGGSLSIGSGPGCDISLQGQGIADTHCLLTCNGHRVVLRDCFTTTGTFVNGKRVSELALEAGTTVVRLGDEDLTVKLMPRQPTSVGLDPITVSADRLPLELQLQAAKNEIQILTERIARTKPVLFAESDDDPFRDEMIDLLRMEIEELHRALHEHPVETSFHSSRDSDAPPSTEDTQLLVSRLEQLLDELQQKDEQVALLHTLLEAAEDANRAELEEREQLNAWVPDIENRFAARELEWQAKYEKLDAENRRIASERDRAEAAAAADTDSAKLEAVQSLAGELRTEAESLRQQLAECERQNQHLQREIQSIQSSVSREEVVRLAQERAELARMRHELEAQTVAIGNKESREEQSVDSNIRVLRQHLLEVHEQEKLEREQRSLSNRIAGLWKRIDGR